MNAGMSKKGTLPDMLARPLAGSGITCWEEQGNINLLFFFILSEAKKLITLEHNPFCRQKSLPSSVKQNFNFYI